MAIPYERLVFEDLNIGNGSVSVSMPAGGAVTGTQLGLRTWNNMRSLRVDYGLATGADATAALQDAVNKGDVWIDDAYTFSSRIDVPNGRTIAGVGRAKGVVNFTGTGDAFRITNPVNGSGYGRVTFKDFTILGLDTSAQVGAGIDFWAGGFAYYNVHRMRIAGFKYGVVFDQAEVSQLRDSIIESSQSVGACVLLTNGAQWRAGSGGGFTNLITVDGNQFNGAFYGVIDDGGNGHTFTNNNFNGQSAQFHGCGIQSLTFCGNSLENSLITTSVFNVALTNLSGIDGATIGPCTNGSISSNTFAGAMNSVGNLLSFTGGAKHYGFTVSGNYFLSCLGRGGAINVDKLSGSVCQGNYDLGIAGMTHYNNLHEDADGNVLFPPNANSTVSDVTTQPYEFGDTARRARFYGSIEAPFHMTSASSVLAISSNTIAPTGSVHHVGAGLIKTITVPATMVKPAPVTIIPDAAFTYDATGNIGVVIGGLAVIGRPMVFTWDGSKWWPSY